MLLFSWAVSFFLFPSLGKGDEPGHRALFERLAVGVEVAARVLTTAVGGGSVAGNGIS